MQNTKPKTINKAKIVIEKVNSNKSEFLEFLKNYNVLELAIGVVIGTALKDLTGAIVADLIMPLIGILTPSGSWTTIAFKIGGSEFKIGDLMANTINFIIIAVFIFIVANKILKLDKIDKKK